jgi:hypothetical protein
MNLRLATPAIALLVPESTFDAFGWCESDWLDCQLVSAGSQNGPQQRVTSENPPGLLFLSLGAHTSFLPQELAALHAPGLGLGEQLALAPYAIDDATDGLYARRLRPRDAFRMLAQDRASLFWGLHDWAHFHNHGPFEARAHTELQCDLTALAWLAHNQATLALSDQDLEVFAQEATRLSEERFASEGLAFDKGALSLGRVRALVTA